MGRWADVAPWAGPIRNSGDGDGRPGETEDRMAGHVGVVIHTAQGSYAGTDAWQRNPLAEVGSHFLTAKDGRVEQLIDTDDRSWCQSAGNSTWISIENEGYGSRGEALTAGQVEACARILAKANQVYGVPLRVSNSPGVAGLGWHGMGGAAWGGHYDCPGTAIRAQLATIVGRAAQIIGGSMDQAQETELLRNAHNSDWAGTAILAGRDPVDGFRQTDGSVFSTPNTLHRKLDQILAAAKQPQPAPGTLTAEQFAELKKAVVDAVVARMFGASPTAG